MSRIKVPDLSIKHMNEVMSAKFGEVIDMNEDLIEMEFERTKYLRSEHEHKHNQK